MKRVRGEMVLNKASKGQIGDKSRGIQKRNMSGRCRGKPKLILYQSGSDELTLILPTVIDALFQRCTEGEGRVAKTVKGAGRVLTPPILTVGGVLALIHICKGHHRHWLQYEHLLWASSS